MEPRLVEVEQLAGTTVLRVRGEIDFTTAPEVRAAISQQLRDSSTKLIIDLNDVTFCGSAGIAALVEAKSQRSDLRLVCDKSSNVLRTLHLHGLTEWFQLGAARA